MLAKQDKCYSQTWHLPTDEPLSGETYIHMVSNILGIEPDYETTDKSVLKFRSVFNKEVAELIEVLYKFEESHHFDSSKFNSYFNYTPVSYYNGIIETIEFLKNYNSVNIDCYAFVNMQ